MESFRSQETFCSWLYQPYLDLSEARSEAPLHVFGIDIDFRCLVDETDYPRIQSVLLPSFKDDLVRLSNTSHFSVRRPEDLPVSLATDRWKLLQDGVRSYCGLSRANQARVLRLLSKLCLYECVLDICSSNLPSVMINCISSAEIRYFHALACYILSLDGRTNSYSLKMFEDIAIGAPNGSLTKVNALYQMVVQNVKHAYDIDRVRYWLPIFKKQIDLAKDHVSEIVYRQLVSRYHRVAGFLPQMEGNRAAVVEEMNLAESVARSIPRDTPMNRVIAAEMLYPVLESRIKEALWLKDFELAESRCRELCTLCPTDPRAHLHFGQVSIELEKITQAIEAYQSSIMYAPPGREIAFFMLGQCFEHQELFDQALSSYRESLLWDPKAEAALKAMISLCRRSGRHPIWEKWAIERAEQVSLAYAANTAKNVSGSAYKQYESRSFE